MRTMRCARILRMLDAIIVIVNRAGHVLHGILVRGRDTHRACACLDSA